MDEYSQGTKIARVKKTTATMDMNRAFDLYREREEIFRLETTVNRLRKNTVADINRTGIISNIEGMNQLCSDVLSHRNNLMMQEPHLNRYTIDQLYRRYDDLACHQI